MYKRYPQIKQNQFSEMKKKEKKNVCRLWTNAIINSIIIHDCAVDNSQLKFTLSKMD